MIPLRPLLARLPERICTYAAEWLDTLPPGTTPQQAWERCDNGAWLLWVASVVRVQTELLMAPALAFARAVAPHLDGSDAANCAHRAMAYLGRWERGEIVQAEELAEVHLDLMDVAKQLDLSGDDVGREAAETLVFACRLLLALSSDTGEDPPVCANDLVVSFANVALHAGDIDTVARAKAFVEAADTVRAHLPWSVMEPFAERLSSEARGES